MSDATTEDISGTTETPKIGHIITKDDQLRGLVNGEEVIALCGYSYVPTRDGDGVPVCEDCEFMLRTMILRILEGNEWDS